MEVINDIGDFVAGLKNRVGTRDELAKSLFDNLFSEKNLLMLGRIPKSEISEYVTMLVITNFYGRYYESCSVNYNLVKTEEYPYIVCRTSEKRPTHEMNHTSSSVEKLMENLLKLSVSLNGLGRNEAVQIMADTQAKLNDKVDKMRWGQAAKT